jgi:adenylate cyclase
VRVDLDPSGRRRRDDPATMQPVARSYSAKEIATEAAVPEERVVWLASLGVLPRLGAEGFSLGSILLTKVLSALLEAGLPKSTIELIAAEVRLNSGHVDEYLPYEPGARSTRSFAEFQAAMGPGGAVLPTVYRTLGLPPPDPSEPIHVDEEEILERFLAVWRPAGENDSILRAARLIGEGTRIVMLGSVDVVDEQIATPARERVFRGEVDRYPEEATLAFTTLTGLLPRMFSWLGARFLEQRVTGGFVDGMEELLAARDLAPPPPATPPPAIVFVDISGFTRLTEQRGDETAVLAATSLQRHADAVATSHGGRLVKLLGDGAMLRFPEAAGATDAALELVETMSREGVLSAHAGVHAGPVIERDLDIFGRTVNLASRIAAIAEPGEVLVTEVVVHAVRDRPFDLHSLGERSLKGITEPVPLFRVAHA